MPISARQMYVRSILTPPLHNVKPMRDRLGVRRLAGLSACCAGIVPAFVSFIFTFMPKRTHRLDRIEKEKSPIDPKKVHLCFVWFVADVNNLNDYVEADSSLEGLTLDEIMTTTDGSVFNNAAQVDISVVSVRQDVLNERYTPLC